MKKVLAIAITLALVFALAVTTSAASLGSKWTELSHFDVDGVANGEVAVSGNSIVLKVPGGGWWPQAGVKFADKLSLDGLEVTFNAKGFTDESPNGYFAVTVSDKPLGNFVNVLETAGLVGGRSYGVGIAGAKTASVTFYGSQLKGWVTDGGSVVGYDYPVFSSAAAGKDVTLSFHDTADGLRFQVNGKPVQVEVEDEESGDYVKEDLIIPEGSYPSGQVYLTLSAVGYGGSGSDAITIKKINGTAANSLGGTSNQGQGQGNVPDTADIDVVIIAGAMVVALAAAAFVLKARKA